MFGDTHASTPGGKPKLASILLMLSIALVLNSASLPAQVIRIRVVNGKNGKPVADLPISFRTEITTWSPPPFLPTDHNGELVVKAGSFTNIAPFTPSPRYKACWTLAAKGQSSSSPLYPVLNVLSEGTSMENNCGKVRVKATPGELIYFVRPSAFWETLTYN
jgi:hypothetical protein